MSRPYCGDWLLLDAKLEPPAPGRSGSWEEAFRGGGYSLFVAPPGPTWVGSPWREAKRDDRRLWLLGESSVDDETLFQVAAGGDASLLGGRFLLLSYSGGQFEVTTDRFGTLHAYALDGGEAVSTSFVAASASSARNLDWLGLTSFFGCGFFFGERTFWQDLRCLGPARRHRLAKPGGGLDSRRYWHWNHQPIERTRGETNEAFSDIFEKVVRESTATGRVALPLSGGLDSRALAAAAPQGRLAWSFGYGYQKGSIEVVLARQIAERRQIPFDGRVIDPYLPTSIDLAFGLVEGFQDLTQTRQLAIAAELADRSDFVLAGHWGDVWLDDMGFANGSIENGPIENGPENRADLAGRALPKLEKRGSAWLLDTLCQPHVGDPRSILAEELSSALGEYDDLEETDYRFKAFKTDHWSCRWTLASVRAYQSAVFPRLPFYDPRLADFFATIPAQALRDRRLEIDYLRSRAPDLASIPWQETGAGLGRSRRAAWWLGLPRRAVARAWRTLKGQQVLERNWQVQLLGPAGRLLLEERLLTPGISLHDHVESLQVRKLLEDFYAQPTASSGYTVSMLLTFAVLLERCR